MRPENKIRFGFYGSPMHRFWKILPALALFGLFLGNRDASNINFFEKGREAMISGDYRSAVHYLSLARNKNPSYGKTRLYLARAYFRMGRYNLARDSYRSALALEPGNARALTGLGRTYAALGDTTLARKYLAEARAKKPGSARINMAFGEYYEKTGDLRAAMGYFRRVERRFPANVGALLGMARVFAKTGDYEKAGEYISRARDINPSLPMTHIALGEVRLHEALEKKGERGLDEAYESLSTALSLLGDNPQIEKKLAYIDIYRRRFNEAKSRLESVYKRDPKDPRAAYLLSYLYRIRAKNNRDLRISRRYASRFIKREPRDPFARFALEEMVLKRPDLFPPGGTVRRALARFQYKKASYFKSLNRLDEYRYRIRRTLRLYPRHKGALARRMRIYRNEGDYESFLRLLRLQRDRNADDPRRQYRLALALKNRDRSLAYREGLYSKEGSPGDETFQRTPMRVLIFDFRPEEAFPARPDAPALIARALRSHLRGKGRLENVSEGYRRRALEEARKLSGPNAGFSFGVYYRPEYLPRLSGLESENETTGYNETADFVLEGSYRGDFRRLTVSFRVYRKDSGRLATSFVLDSSGVDALHDIAERAAARLTQLAKLRGRVVKLKPGFVFLNLGSIDGLKKGERILLYRKTDVRRSETESRDGFFRKIAKMENAKGKICRTDIVSRYASRCRPENFSWNAADVGDAAVRYFRF